MVVFPAPLRPISASRSPGRSSRCTPSSTVCSPWCLSTWWRAARITPRSVPAEPRPAGGHRKRSPGRGAGASREGSGDQAKRRLASLSMSNACRNRGRQQLDLVAGGDAGVRVDRATTSGRRRRWRGCGSRRRAARRPRPGLDDVLALGDRGVAAQAEVLRADADVDLLALGGAQLLRELAVRGEVELRALQVAVLDGADQEVHRGRAHEAGDELVDRLVVEVDRAVDLLDQAVLHDHDARAHRHRLDLVVGDVDGGDAEAAVQLADRGAHLDAQLGVEVRQRLVHQEDLRLAHDRAPEGDALALAAGELARPALEQVVDLQQLRGLADAPLDVGLGVLRSRRPNDMFWCTFMCG
jgi:hypothetical protein